MKAVELLSQLRSLDIRLWVEGDRLRYSAPDGVMTPALRAELVAHKAEILTLLHQAKAAFRQAPPPLRPVPRDRDLPLSFAQQRMWVLDRLMPGNAYYNIPSAVRMKGKLEVAAMERSFEEIMRRHEVMRTTFPDVNGEPVQVISPDVSLRLPLVDLSGLSESEREAEARRLAAEEASRPFDLARGPLLRACLLRIGTEDHIFLFTLHHIICDGWSRGILIEEFVTLYKAFTLGQRSPLPDLPLQYADFACWQREWLQGEVLERQISYWKQRLAGSPPALELPTDRPRPAVQTFRGALKPFRLSPELSKALEELSLREGATLFMTLLAAFQTLLYRYSGQEDIIVGSAIANRTHPETERLIGYFVNILVLRTDLSGDPSFRQLLRRVREVTLEAYAHQELPFEKLVGELQLDRDPSRTPLAQVGFALQNVPVSTLELPELSLSPLEEENPTAKFDLTLFMSQHPEYLSGVFEYNTDLFDASTIARMLDHFQRLLEGIVADPDQRLSALPPSPVLSRRAAPKSQKKEFADIYERSNLTKYQLLIWGGQRLYPDTPLYNNIFHFIIPAEVDPVHFQRAFQTLVNSSDALRTVVQEVDGVPQQRVVAELPYTMQYLDFSFASDPRAAARNWARPHLQVPSDLEKRLFDAALIKLSEREYIWHLNLHHIIGDVGSFIYAFRYVSEFYELSLEDRLEERVALPPFQDYIRYEREIRGSPQYLEAAAYWQEKLAEEVEPLTFYGKPALKQTTQTHRVSCDLGLERTAGLKAMAAREEVFTKSLDASLANIFTALLCTYLYRISGNRRLSLGLPYHNRRSKAFRETIGQLIQVLPLRITIAEDETFLSLIKKIADENIKNFRYLEYPVGNSWKQQIYDVEFNYLPAADLKFRQAPVKIEWFFPGHANESLTLQVHDLGLSGKFILEFDFNHDIFSEAERTQAVQHFLRVLDAFLEDYHYPINRADLLLLETQKQKISALDSEVTFDFD